MPDFRAIHELLAKTRQHATLDQALKEILDAARALTGSRNVLFAKVDHEEGKLDFDLGSGPDWDNLRSDQSLDVQLGTKAGITAHVAATGQPFVTGDVALVEAYHQLFSSTRSELAVPVFDANHKLVGVLNCESELQDNYTQTDLVFAEMVAAIASFAIDREASRLREEALLDIGKALEHAFTEEEILERVIDIAFGVLRLQACSIFLFDQRTQTYVLRASSGALRNRVGELAYQPEEGFTGWVCSSGEPILLDHPQSDPRWRGKFTEIPSEQIASFLAVPIMIRGRSLGAIRALRKYPDNEYLDNRFGATDLRLMSSIAEQTAFALDSARAISKLVQNERLAAWGELSAKSSHMIGNRVFALSGDINELSHQLSLDPLNRGDLLKLHAGLATNLTRLQELLQEFRDFVAATQLNLTLGDLNEMVMQVVEEVFPQGQLASCEVGLQTDLPLIRFDKSKLNRAISELIENALHFVEAGTVRVSTSWADKDTLAAAKLDRSAAFVQIVVEDNGPGVESSRKMAIFEPFHSSRVKGLGLGLSIVKGIADAHGGTVLETGESGKGARFVVLLPAPERQNSGGL